MPPKPGFVYVTLIATTPEKLWEAITSPEFTRQYWFDTEIVCDWKAGARVEYHWRGQISDDGEVLVSEPPRKLSYTFHPLLDDDLRGEPPSKVTFLIEPLDGRNGARGNAVQLTVIHDDFEIGSKVFPQICSGWPYILSGLKTLLETGKSLELEWVEEETA